MLTLHPHDPVAVAVVEAIRGGDVDTLQRLLGANLDLATATLGHGWPDAPGPGRSLLHVATDWPGHFPNSAATVAALVAAGADVNARFIRGPDSETPLHWAASSDDVAALDALLDAGADIEAPGAVHTGGTPMSDAVVFGQWQAARRLLERGARTTFWQAAALGLLARVEECCEDKPPPPPDQVTNAFWSACHGGQRQTAEYLLGRGAELNWVGYDGLTPLAAALRSGAEELVEWLRDQGAKSAEEMD